MKQFTVLICSEDIKPFLESLGSAGVYVLGFAQLEKKKGTLMKILPANTNVVQTPEIVDLTLAIIRSFNLKVKEEEVNVEKGKLKCYLTSKTRYSSYNDLSELVLQECPSHLPEPISPETITPSDLPTNYFPTFLLDQFTVHAKYNEVKELLKRLNKCGVIIRAYLYFNCLFKFIPTNDCELQCLRSRYQTYVILEELGLKYSITQVVAIKYLEIAGQLGRAANLLNNFTTKAAYYSTKYEDTTWGIYETSSPYIAQKVLSG